MADVWAATDVFMGEPIAVKLLKPEVASKAGGKPLLVEAKALYQLTHQNIVRLRHFEPPCEGPGPTDGYIVLELLGGVDLETLIRQRREADAEDRFSPADLRWIARQIGEALHFAHGLKVLHRDIKPANMLFDRKFSGALQGSGALLKLADFGIARKVTSTTANATAPVSAGTPPYMAPELFAGERASVQSDLYALGVSLYYAFHGELPYPTQGDWLTALEAPVPELGSGDPALDLAVARCMAKHPEHRPSSVSEWLSSLGMQPGSGSSPEPSADDSAGADLLQASATSPNRSLPVRLACWWNEEKGIASDDLIALQLHNTLPTEVEFELEAEVQGDSELSCEVLAGEGRLAKNATDCAFLQVRGRARGAKVLRLGLHLRQSGQQPDTWYAFESSAAGIPIGCNGEQVRLGLRAADSESFWEKLRESLPPLQQGSSPHPVPLVRTSPAHGFQEPRRSEGAKRHYLLDVWDGCQLHSRTHLFFQRDLQMGRQPRAENDDSVTGAAENDVVLRYLPIRSPEIDPLNWRRTRAISRRLCHLHMDSKGSSVTRRLLTPSPAGPGDATVNQQVVQREIHRGEPLSIRFGAADKPMTLVFSAHRGDGRSRDASRIFRRGRGYSSLSNLMRPTYHASVLCRREGNGSEFSYALVSDWISCGGGSEDAIGIAGVPTACLRFLNHSATPFVLAGEGVREFRVSETRRRLWTPIGSGGTGMVGPYEFELRPSNASETGAEADLLCSAPPGVDGKIAGARG